MTANFLAVDIKKILINIEYKWADALSEKKMSLNKNFPTDKEVLTDSFLLELILDNLVSNAIKYGREHGNIYIEWNAKDNSLTISDDGNGIAAEHLPHLFERFYRTDNSRNSKIPGNGLGLAIVHKIANLLNIRITVNSTEGAGTSFTLHFIHTSILS